MRRIEQRGPITEALIPSQEKFHYTLQNIKYGDCLQSFPKVRGQTVLLFQVKVFEEGAFSSSYELRLWKKHPTYITPLACNM